MKGSISDSLARFKRKGSEERAGKKQKGRRVIVLYHQLIDQPPCLS